jgi:uncharacterized surface protein with fasciclin (FAS1) repeats
MNKFSSLLVFLIMAVAMAGPSGLRGAAKQESQKQQQEQGQRKLHNNWWNWNYYYYYAPPPPDIVDTAIATPGLETLVSLVQLAGLEDTLRGPGPFTVFAPTDDAFAKLPADTVTFLTSDEGKETLTNILLYHVLVGGRLRANRRSGWGRGGPWQTAIQGATVRTSLFRRGWWGGLVYKVNGAEVLVRNVNTANGIVHVIDDVLIPPS